MLIDAPFWSPFSAWAHLHFASHIYFSHCLSVNLIFASLSSLQTSAGRPPLHSFAYTNRVYLAAGFQALSSVSSQNFFHRRFHSVNVPTPTTEQPKALQTRVSDTSKGRVRRERMATKPEFKRRQAQYIPICSFGPYFPNLIRQVFP